MTINKDNIFTHLVYITGKLKVNDIDHFVSCGTLLGALREGAIIEHDDDFDLDCFSCDKEKILSLNDNIDKDGYKIVEKVCSEIYCFSTMEISDEQVDSSCLEIFYKDTYYGDINLFQIFDDGLSRRWNEKTKTYVEARYTIPAWYYEESTLVQINGEEFSAPRCPELILQKQYGVDWTVPKKRGGYSKGADEKSGSVLDSNLEYLFMHAIKRGWDGDYSDRAKWPTKIMYIDSFESFDWVKKHEPFFLGLNSDKLDYKIHEPEVFNKIFSSVENTSSFQRNIIISYYANTFLIKYNKLYKAKSKADKKIKKLESEMNNRFSSRLWRKLKFILGR